MSGMTVFLELMELLALLAILFSMEAGKEHRDGEGREAGWDEALPAGEEDQQPEEEHDLMAGILALMQYGAPEKKDKKEDKT